MNTPRRPSRFQAALQRGDERLFERTEYQPIEEPEVRPPHVSLCATCYGMGFYKLDVPVTHPKFGKPIKCTDPDCQAQEYIRRQRQATLESAYGYNDAGEDYSQYTFNSWLNLPLNKQQGKELPLMAAQRLAKDPFTVFTLAQLYEDWGKPFKLVPANPDSENSQDWQEYLVVNGATLQNNFGNWIVYQGGYGTGKTGLAMAALNAAKANGYYTVFVRLPDYIEAWQRTYNYTDSGEREDAQKQLKEQLAAAELLVVDEVNVAEDSTGRASHDKIRIFTDYIINPRWKAGVLKPTIFTTNKPVDSFFKHWGERIATRVLERAHWFEFAGDMLRHQNKPVR